jgi:hypothetical protein
MKIGATARVKQPVLAGPIADKRLNVEKDELEYLVVYTDPAGETQHRWFLESELQEVA